MRWKKRDEEKGCYVKKFLIFPELYGDTWCWLEMVYLFTRRKFYYSLGRYVVTEELATKHEYMDFKRREAEEREREKNERRAEKEKRNV